MLHQSFTYYIKEGLENIPIKCTTKAAPAARLGAAIHTRTEATFGSICSFFKELVNYRTYSDFLIQTFFDFLPSEGYIQLGTPQIVF